VLLVIGAITAVAAWPRDRAKGGGEPVAAGNQTSVSAGPAVDEAELLWRANTGVAAVEPPAVSAERIVVSGQDGTLRSYRRADGTLEWKVALGAGTRAATHIAGGVVVASTDDGHLIGIDPAQGKVRWRKDVGGQIGARPLTAGVLAYAGGRDGVLTAYGIGNGDRRWRLRTQGEISRPPTVIGGVVVVASGDGKLYGVSPDGEKLWTATAGQVSDGPVGTGHAACVAVDNGTVRCVQSEDGAELDGIADTVTIEGIAGGDGVLYTAGSDGSVGAWDPATAKQLWRKPGSGGSVRLVPAAGEVDVAYPDGSLAGLDARSGEVRWRNTTGDKFSIAPGSDGAGLFAVGDSGVLYALRPPAGAVVPPTPSVEPTTEPATEPSAENRETRRTTKPTYYRSTRPSRTASPSASTTPPTTPPTTEPTSQPSGA
jgi:outer membrane protein assembly factor BamB